MDYAKLEKWIRDLLQEEGVHRVANIYVLAEDIVNMVKDLAEVIRCEDCDMSYYSESGKNLWCGVFDKIVEEDGFCWLGDRKEGAK